MASEVAVQQLKGIAEQVRQEGETLNAWLEEAGLAPISMENTQARLDWKDYAAILEVVGQHRSAAWLVERGEDSIYDDEAGLFRSGLLIGHDDCGLALEWMVAPYGPFAAVSPYLDNELTNTGDRRYDLRTTMTEGLEPSRWHHHFVSGVLAGYPRVLYEQRARVAIEPTERGAVYHIEFSPPSPLAGWRRKRRRAKPQPDYMKGVGATYLALVQRQQALQAEQAHSRELERRALRAERQESLGQLTGSVAHDFRNLLSVSLAQLDLLRLEVADDEHKRAIQEVIDTCKRGTDLTTRLLTYACAVESQEEAADILDIVRSMQPILANGLGRRGKLEMQLVDEVGTVMLEPSQLENALLNLIVNARDAIEPGGIVTVRVSNTTVEADSDLADDCAPGAYTLLSVSDNGSGIEAEVAHRIFDPYFTTKPEGSGLGLSSVWGFVKQCGGHIRLQSSPGEGSTFDLFLPVASP